MTDQPPENLNAMGRFYWRIHQDRVSRERDRKLIGFKANTDTIDFESSEVALSVEKWLSSTAGTLEKVNVEDIPFEIDVDALEQSQGSNLLTLFCNRLKFPSRRSFNLGSIMTGPALMQSSASYRAVRGKGGTSWKLFVDGADFSWQEQLFGSYTSEEVREIIDQLGYELTLRDWLSMGWRPSNRAGLGKHA